MTDAARTDGFALGEILPDAFAGTLHATVRVRGLAFDSRKVQPGDVFVALAGAREDGRRYITDALARGAAAVVAEGGRPEDFPREVIFGSVIDARRALALAAARVFPRQPATIVAVTGTSGKSSVAEFTRQLFAACGHEAASLGTIGVVAPSGAHYGSLTTPDPIALHRTLDRLAGEGVTHLAMEASSHGLDQRRLDGVRLAAAAFTNLGRDHLDYHPTVEAYLTAKLRLFERLLPEGAIAVVNADAPEAARIETIAEARGLDLISVGRAGRDIAIADVAREGFSQRLKLAHEGHFHEVLLPLAGDFQAANAVVAAGLALAAGCAMEDIIHGLAGIAGVKGRLERVAEVNGALVVVDYAHKPDALAHVLDALRPYATGRLFVVVGAGGDRDPGKRPMMGAIASEKADVVIVTDDNPRSENPAAIRAAILAAAPNAREIGDRAAAIRTAVAELGPGDVLVVAGKGHETGQIVGSTTIPFSDHEAVLAAVADLER
ncbi:UDP-N-acetylmuramoyl-L-alanyl-D-glutamate--2,6-diaminopimelate ligase [Chelatococcus daeguensis]|uniref:UDP-N-acetylmuramoyl-L-alanyl-D-glutamate--2,6-diaminopimelate ligase n=1 Tax=Chelatococcus daeguensis TaxID=444444 RepID=A0AAC9JT36_9HYPH|nr:UDP-N-acetylmuramoyl-L-alanyl-D-glutamate--2,6-diaminopimelate ligase [Chelatococcus daeguensis]APF38081.1 UDP-N-acetylmuramoyl-L-alanyl-D-glutamate--2,6-diaminopimelate ligase [Chelatococcus daeguensis]